MDSCHEGEGARPGFMSLLYRRLIKVAAPSLPAKSSVSSEAFRGETLRAETAAGLLSPVRYPTRCESFQQTGGGRLV